MKETLQIIRNILIFTKKGLIGQRRPIQLSIFR
jgi:hypothetical protein